MGCKETESLGRCGKVKNVVYIAIERHRSLWTRAAALPPPAPFSPRDLGPWRRATGGVLVLHNFTPQEVFLVVFSAIIVVAYLVNRAHCYDLKRNKNQAH